MSMPVDTSANSSFSVALPGFQTAVDSTSLFAFKTCPRLYYYQVICGWVPKRTSVHLTFGLLYHGALERYDHKRSEGLSHADSTDFVVDWVLRSTWNTQLRRPWTSGDPNKNRLTLLRTIVDYLDRFGEHDSLTTVQLANGKPAVELSFSFFSGKRAGSTGEEVAFCGHLDRLVELNGDFYISDRKTTKHTISPEWFKQFTPHNQFSMYTLAGQVVWEKPVKGLIVDGAQVLVGSSRFVRGVVSRDSAQIKEWHQDTMLQIELMESYAMIAYWPMNDSSCDKFGGCQFREVCGRSPVARDKWLEVDFHKRIWDPLQRRGDI